MGRKSGLTFAIKHELVLFFVLTFIDIGAFGGTIKLKIIERRWARESLQNIVENQYLAVGGHNYFAVGFNSEKHGEMSDRTTLTKECDIMECFVLTSLTRDRYIYFDDCRRISVTTDVNQAEFFFDITKAYNFLGNQMPKKKRDEWIVVTAEVNPPKDSKQRFRTDLDFSESDAEFHWDNYINNIMGSYRGIRDYREYLQKELAKVEAELCDIEHAIEFFNYNASDGYKMYKMLHDCRVRRREIKDDLRKANAVLSMR